MVKRYLNLLLIFTSLVGFSLSAENRLISSQRMLSFAGVSWTVRGGYGGPGPNYWSDSDESVWLDSDGHLHMRIRKINDRWYCSEVFTNHFTQYGEHRFVVEGEIDGPDKSTVLGLFVYADDTHEIDIEFSKWGNPDYTEIASYTIQPYTVSGNSEIFAVQIDDSVSTHMFNWQENYVIFTSFEGLKETASTRLNFWRYSGNYIPKDSDKLRTHINFWLFQGNAPVDTTNLEVIIRDVRMPATGTSVDQPDNLKPKSFHLDQNYPNPFNPQTTIRFNLNRAEEVSLNIYDIQGKKIQNLIRGRYTSGIHRVIWDGRDEVGNKASSGVYLYVLQTQEEILTRKMIMVR